MGINDCKEQISNRHVSQQKDTKGLFVVRMGKVVRDWLQKRPPWRHWREPWSEYWYHSESTQRLNAAPLPHKHTPAY